MKGHLDVNIVQDYIFPTAIPEDTAYYSEQETNNCIDFDAFYEYYTEVKHFECGKYLDWHSNKYGNPPQTYNQIPKFIANENRISFYHYKTISKKQLKERDMLFIYPIALFSQANNSLGDYENIALDKISKEAIKEIKTKENFYLMISYFYEGLLYTEEMENLYKWIAKHEIPENKIYLVYANYDIDDWWNDISKSDIINKKLNLIPYNWPLQYMPDDYKKIINDYAKLETDFLPQERKVWDVVLGNQQFAQSFNIEYKVEKKKYDFNCLLRQLRYHRILLLCWLRMNGLLNKNLISYDLGALGFTFDDGYHWLVDGKNTVYNGEESNDETPMSWPFRNKEYIYQFAKLYIEEPKKVIDIEDTENIHGLCMETDIPYKDSMFSVVSESYFFEKTKVHYISEKVIKPMMHRHPYILFAKDGVLQFMRDKGFKTFQPYINEDYDKEDNDVIRFTMIQTEIERLCNLTDKEKLEWMKKIKPIVNYNFNHFINYPWKKEDKRIFAEITKKKII